MKALVHLGFGEKIPDCTKCRTEPRLREQYGCDGPAAAPVLYVSGPGESGTPLYRCPGKLTEHRSDLRDAYWLCRRFEENGLLPADGGLSDQSPAWLDLLSAYMTERHYVENLEDLKKQKRTEKLQDLRMRMAVRDG